MNYKTSFSGYCLWLSGGYKQIFFLIFYFLVTRIKLSKKLITLSSSDIFSFYLFSLLLYIMKKKIKQTWFS